MMKSKIKRIIFRTMDLVLSPISIPMAFFNKKLRKNRFRDFPLFRKAYYWVGVYPIIDHYYEPLFNTKHLKRSFRLDRNLPGINFNDKEQLEILEKFNYNKELENIPQSPGQKREKNEYCYTEGPFLSGDAEYLYNMIRHFRPNKIMEIGSGHSTLLARKAIGMNTVNDKNYRCNHICIEPYEHKWLEELNIEVIRQKVEDLDNSIFNQLHEKDILFIDSSHIIRPQGDVLFEYLELLPILNSGVIIHIHDIFTPKDYLNEWFDIARFWNEQYLLEAFLCNNHDFRIIGATNYLMHKYYNEFSAKCPILKQQKENGIEREPGSFWMIRN
jgi:hypothetical protein